VCCKFTVLSSYLVIHFPGISPAKAAQNAAKAEKDRAKLRAQLDAAETAVETQTARLEEATRMYQLAEQQHEKAKPVFEKVLSYKVQLKVMKSETEKMRAGLQILKDCSVLTNALAALPPADLTALKYDNQLCKVSTILPTAAASTLTAKRVTDTVTILRSTMSTSVGVLEKKVALIKKELETVTGNRDTLKIKWDRKNSTAVSSADVAPEDTTEEV
jgi:hypothetical protein